MSYSVSPALPMGLVIDAKRGVISGTPTVSSAKAVYTVTATNAGGSTTAALSIAVTGPAFSISYSSYYAFTANISARIAPTVLGANVITSGNHSRAACRSGVQRHRRDHQRHAH